MALTRADASVNYNEGGSDMRIMILCCLLLATGCVATTRVVVTHKPQDDLTYTVTREWKRTF